MNSARREPQSLSPAAVAEGERRSAEPTSLKQELPSRSIIGRVLQSRYVPEALLVEGSFSVRYLAEDTATREAVCIELLPRRAVACFAEIRQAVAKLAALGDPNIIAVSGRGMVGGAWPFLVTEHGPRTLQDMLGLGPLVLEQVVRLGAQSAGALAAAHGAGVIHGALALDRLVCSGSAPLTRVKVCGFGLAPLVESSSEVLLGAAPEARRHASPEHLTGARLEARSDVYSLGSILYELATGTPPFGSAGGPSGPLSTRDPEAPSRRRGSNELAFRVFDKIVERCLKAAPEERYATASELAVDLGRLDAALGRAQAAARARRAQPGAPAQSAQGTPRGASDGRRRNGRPSAVELSPARRPPPKAAVSMRELPKVIVQAG